MHGAMLLLLVAAPEAPDLRLVHLHEGLRQEAPEDDPARIAETETFRLAAKRGVDLAKPEHPLFAHRFANGRLYYLFYKTTENAFGDRPYLIQRIRKTERTWKAQGAEPEERITYQVEVFKTLAGALKGADQHFGDFGLRDAHRREIVKEYEVGFGEIPGVCEGRAWPFLPGSLFEKVHPYAEEKGPFDAVAFTASRRWTLTVEFARDGEYAIRAPDLGIDAPRRLPDPTAAAPKRDAASAGVVLLPGAGVGEARIGESAPEDVVRLFGEPLADEPAGTAGRNLSTPRSLTFNFGGSGKLNTVITRSGFAGRTKDGIAHGMTRAEVLAKRGPPAGQRADAAIWRYDGVQLTFDGFGRVSRIVVFRG